MKVYAILLLCCSCTRSVSGDGAVCLLQERDILSDLNPIKKNILKAPREYIKSIFRNNTPEVSQNYIENIIECSYASSSDGMQEVIIKKNKEAHPQNSVLLFQCDPLVAEPPICESKKNLDQPAVDTLCKRRGKELFYFFCGVSLSNKPYIYELTGVRPKSEMKYLKENQSILSGASLLEQAKNILNVSKPNGVNLFYCCIVIISIFTTYYLDKVELSQATKDSLKHFLEHLITGTNQDLNPFSDNLLDNIEVSAYLRRTLEEILSGKLVIFPYLIDTEALSTAEAVLSERLLSLNLRGSELSGYIQTFAEMCIVEVGIENTPKHAELFRLVLLHIKTYSYEAMLSLLKSSNIKEIKKEHTEETFKLFSREIMGIVQILRKHFTEVSSGHEVISIHI